MFCERCGKEAQDGQSFCPYCGNKNETVILEKKQPESVHVSTVVAETVVAKKIKKLKLPFILIAALLVVCIIAGVVFVPGLLEKKRGTTTIWVASEYSYSNYLKLEFKYREDGLISEANRWFYSDTVSEETMGYLYDKNYNVIEQTFSNADRSRFFSYDKNGNMLSDITYYEGEVENESYYSYDENDRLIKKIELNREYIYEYDKNGNLICEKEISQDGYTYKTLHKYDNLNRRVETEDNNGRSVYKYDIKNKLTEIIRYTDGSEEGRCVFEYDDNGNLIRIKKIASRENIHIYGDFTAGDTVNMTTIKYTQMEVDSDMVEIIKEKQGFEWVFNDIYDYHNW